MMLEEWSCIIDTRNVYTNLTEQEKFIRLNTMKIAAVEQVMWVFTSCFVAQKMK